MHGRGVFARMFATAVLAAVLATASPSLTPGPEVVLDPLFLRYPAALSIGGMRDAIVVAGTTINGSNPQAFYQVIESVPRDRVFLPSLSQNVQVVTSGAETLLAWRDATGTQVLFPLHADAVVRHIDNTAFYFAIPTPDGFRVFSTNLINNVSSVAINADGSSTNVPVAFGEARPPAAQSRTHFVIWSSLPSGDALFPGPPVLYATPVGQTDVEVIDVPFFTGRAYSVARNGDSAMFLIQNAAGLETVAVDLAGKPHPAASRQIVESTAILQPSSMAWTGTPSLLSWTGTNYLAVWTEKGDRGARNVRGLLLDREGKAAGVPFTIAANAEAPALAGLGGGEAAVVYVTADEGLPRLVLRRLSPPPPAHRRAVR